MAETAEDGLSEITLLGNWYRRVVLSQQSHYNTAAYYKRLHYALGIPVVALSWIGAATAFGAPDQALSTVGRLCIGGIGIVASVLASLQTFFAFGELAAKHGSTGARYGILRREIELAAVYVGTDGARRQFFQELKEQIDATGIDAPEIPSHVWHKTEVAYRHRFGEDFRIL